MGLRERGASQGSGSAFHAQGGAGGGKKQPRLRQKADPTEQELQQWHAQVFGNSVMPHASLPLSDGGLARRPPRAGAIQTSVPKELSQGAAEVLRTFADDELWRGCLHGSLQEALDGSSMEACLPGKRIVCLFESKTGEVCVLCAVCCVLCCVCCVLCAVCVVCSCMCATQKLVCGYDLIVWVTS